MPATENIGFDTQDIRESSKHRKFNETMAACHLLRCQACQDNDSSVHTKSMDTEMTPFPSAEDPHKFPLPHPRRRASEPSLQILVSSTENPPLRQRREKNVPYLSEKTPTLGRGHKRSMTAPLICFPRRIAREVEDTRFSTSSRSETPFSGPEPRRTSPAISLHPRGWARWKKRIRTCIVRLCCCISHPTKSVQGRCIPKSERSPHDDKKCKARSRYVSLFAFIYVFSHVLVIDHYF